MSNQFRNGYRLAEGTDIFDFTSRLRTVLDPVRAKLDAKFAGNLAATAIDKAWDAGETAGHSPAIDAILAYMDLQYRLPKDSPGHDPFSFNAVFGKDPVTGRILVYIYCEAPDLLDVFHAMPEVEEYGHWSANVIPGGMSQTAWDERYEAWSRVWPPYEPFRYQLFEFTHRDLRFGGLLTCLALAADEGNPEAIPSRGDRARNLIYPKAVSYLKESGLADEREAPFAAVRAIDGLVFSIAPLLPELTPETLTQGLDGHPGREEYLAAVPRHLESAFSHLR